MQRARVRLAGLKTEHVRRLAQWLGRHPDVKRARPRKDTLLVEYEEGAFGPALRDQLFRLSHPPHPLAHTVTIEHRLPGRVRLRVQGLGPSDLHRLSAWLATVAGVRRVAASEAAESLVVLFDVEQTTADAIARAAADSRASDWPPGKRRRRHIEAARTGGNTAVLALALSGMGPPAVTTAAVALTALPVLRRAYTAVREKRVSVDVLDVAAVSISLARAEPVTAALITWLLGIGDLTLEHVADQARDALAMLSGLQPNEAWLVRDGRLVRIAAARIKPGQVLRVHAGERLPADGTVIVGEGTVDERALTGESAPRAARRGDAVLAASVLQQGTFDIAVSRAGHDTVAASIVSTLDEAADKPMTLQREMQHKADGLVLPTLALGAVAGAISGEVARTTGVLIADFSSGIRVAVPTAALAEMRGAAREGILFKGGQYLERLSKVDVIVFDKTGTLTEGAQRVVDVAAWDGVTADELLELAASAEVGQTHPSAVAIREVAAAHACTPARGATSEYVAGGGVRALVRGRRVLLGNERLMRDTGVPVRQRPRSGAPGSTVFVALDGQAIGAIVLADTMREETVDVLRALRTGGRRELVLMSGDVQGPVEAFGRTAGIDRRMAGMLPQDKARAIRAMQHEGHVVAMVGDGINDAPALAVADVGVSIHGGTDVALETADVVLVDGTLAQLPRAFEYADHAMHNVRRSLAMVIAPNAAAMVLSAFGLMSPTVTTLVNNGATVAAALCAALGTTR